MFEQLKIKSKDQTLVSLRALDKIDRLGWEEVKELFGEGRKDKSGDFTKGAKLKTGQIKIIENALNSKTAGTEDFWKLQRYLKLITLKIINSIHQLYVD